MAPTPKRADPTKRGRFNTGEKEAISIATEAEIRTKGTTILFPESGGRVITDNNQLSGTTVTLSMPWDPSVIPELIQMLNRFIPTDCALSVNGEAIPPRTPLKVHPTALPTIIQQAPGLPMRYRTRNTIVHILDPVETPAWIFEMGIPIQTTDLPYDVNVMQKVPMPPNRDTVGAPYLKHISAEVLNAMYDTMAPTAFADTWVRTGIEDDRVKDDAVIATKQNRYGENVVMWSSKKDANLRAAEAGFEVVHPKTLSQEERTKLATIAGVKSANEVFGVIPPSGPPLQETDVLKDFSAWVTHLASLASLEATTQFLHSPEATLIATCSANTKTPTITFNTAKLSNTWFKGRGADQLSLVIHELAHALAETPMEHGPTWGEKCAELGGTLAHALSAKHPGKQK